MNARIAGLLVLIWSGLIPVEAGAQPRLMELTDQFARQFSAALGEAEVPGGAYVIVHQGQILDLGVYGHADVNRQRAVDAYTVFRIASLSKGFSGVLAAELSSTQRFALDQPIAELVPSFKLRRPLPPLTVEDVLGQRSGFVRNAYDNLLEAGLKRAEILPRFSELEPLCPPGDCYSYQNNIFSLIEDIAERSTGQEWAALMHDRVFQPLGMARASIGYQALVEADNRADPHLKTARGWRGVAPRSTYYQVPSAAGINASIFDMAQWAIAMLGHRPEVVSAPVIAEVTRPRIETPGELRGRNWRGRLDSAWYGLGWRIYRLEDAALVLHGGWVAGYRAEIALSHDLDLGLVILSNAETRAVGALNRSFWDLAFAAPAQGTTKIRHAATTTPQP